MHARPGDLSAQKPRPSLFDFRGVYSFLSHSLSLSFVKPGAFDPRSLAPCICRRFLMAPWSLMVSNRDFTDFFGVRKRERRRFAFVGRGCVLFDRAKFPLPKGDDAVCRSPIWVLPFFSFFFLEDEENGSI